MFQRHPYSIVLAISAVIITVVIFIARRRTAPGSMALKGMLFGMMFWSVFYALTWMAVPLEKKILALKFMYIGVEMVPTFFLVFTLRITHRENWFAHQSLILIFLEPVTIITLMWIAPQLIFPSITHVTKYGYSLMDLERGRWFWFNTVYSYGIILFALALLVISYRSANSFFKKQYLIVLLGSIIPFVLSIYTQVHYVSFEGLDLAPLSFSISGAAYAYAIFRHQFMDLVPVARSRLVENMSDGVLVLDMQGRVVDINPGMATIFGEERIPQIGEHVLKLMGIWNSGVEFLLNGRESHVELPLSYDPPQYVDLRVSPLYDSDHHLNGSILVARDITLQKKVEEDLRNAMVRMQSQMIEIGNLQKDLREQAIRDPLTNLFNRRYLEETLERELARAKREGYSLSVVMMDIDHFKDINDTYSHEAGDLVLKALAATMTSHSRHGDFVCRYGGEEFVLVMPNISIEISMERAEKILKTVRSLRVPFERYQLHVTVSMGISYYPAHGTTQAELLRSADKALYAAKSAGRNRVVVCKKP